MLFTSTYNDREMPSFLIHTLGCKLNQAESESLSRNLLKTGYSAATRKNADIIILNTCTVTAVADSKSRQWLKAARRENPGALLMVTGCYAQRSADMLEKMGVANRIVCNGEKDNIPQMLTGLGFVAREQEAELKNEPVHTRSNIKIQEGCDHHCSYCIVPLVRGEPRSVPATQVIREVREREREGYHEVVLTGSVVGMYRDNGLNLAGLLRTIMDKTKIDRLRVSSLEVRDISRELLNLWEEARLCRHFHVSLQSGSDNVLLRMGRGYDAAAYLEIIELIKEMVPGAAVTTDIMVGFPGETESDFNRTMELTQEAGFARIHVFPFSPRPGTDAALFGERVDEKTKKERAKKMLAVAQESALHFREAFLGSRLQVLWEAETEPGSNHYSGLTDNYIRVYLKSVEPLINRITAPLLSALTPDGISATLS